MQNQAFPARAVAAPLDEQNHVAGDVHCRRCGYNLRGLAAEGVCPECGTAVGRSLRGDLLQFCDPDWVATLASGMNWIVGAIVAAVLLMFLGGGAGFMMARSGAEPVGLFRFLIPLAQMAAATIGLIGYWKVTTSDPSGLEQPNDISARKLIRVAQLVGLAWIPVGELLEPVSDVAFGLGAAAAGILGLIGTFAIFVYARRLALRIPDARLARSTRIVMWGVATLLGLSILIGVAAVVGAVVTRSALPPAGGPSPAMSGAMLTLTGTFACVIGPGWVVFGIWSLLLIDRYRKAFRDEAQLARATWAAAVPGARPAPVGQHPAI